MKSFIHSLNVTKKVKIKSKDLIHRNLNKMSSKAFDCISIVSIIGLNFLINSKVNFNLSQISDKMTNH